MSQHSTYTTQLRYVLLHSRHHPHTGNRLGVQEHASR
jgi:hypothetical protein